MRKFGVYVEPFMVEDLMDNEIDVVKFFIPFDAFQYLLNSNERGNLQRVQVS